jgi:hypothetical protein
MVLKALKVLQVTMVPKERKALKAHRELLVTTVIMAHKVPKVPKEQPVT